MFRSTADESDRTVATFDFQSQCTRRSTLPVEILNKNAQNKLSKNNFFICSYEIVTF